MTNDVARGAVLLLAILAVGCAPARYRVHWRSVVTGTTGTGEVCLPKADAEAWRDTQAWPLEQWIERCKR